MNEWVPLLNRHTDDILMFSVVRFRKPELRLRVCSGIEVSLYSLETIYFVD